MTNQIEEAVALLPDTYQAPEHGWTCFTAVKHSELLDQQGTTLGLIWPANRVVALKLAKKGDC